MLRYVYGKDEPVTRLVARLIPHIDRGFPLPRWTIGIIDEQDRLIAGAVYYYWNKRNGTIEMAMATLPDARWCTRESIRHICGFPFMGFGCQMMIMRVRAENKRLLRLLKRFGCEFAKVPRLYGRDSDGVMCLLTAEAYARHSYAQRFAEAA